MDPTSSASKSVSSAIMSEKKTPSTEEQPGRLRDEERGSIEQDQFYATQRGKGELDVVRIRERTSVLRKLRAAEAWLDAKLGVEKVGAERIPEDQRRPPSIVNVSDESGTVFALV